MTTWTSSGNEQTLTENSSYERSLLIQAVLTCGTIEIRTIINLLPLFAFKMFGEKAIIPLNIFINCYVILSHGVLPTVYFIYNKRARNIAKYLFLHLNWKKDRNDFMF